MSKIHCVYKDCPCGQFPCGQFELFDGTLFRKQVRPAPKDIPMDTTKEKLAMAEFANELIDHTHNHEHWVMMVKYGLKTLLDNQELLIELITREATIQEARFDGKHDPARDAGYYARGIFAELGLTLTARR